MKKVSIFILAALIAVLALAACDGSLPGIEPEAAGPEEGEAYPGTEQEAGEAYVAPEQEESGAPAPDTGVEKTIYVGSEMVDCEGEGPQKCLLVKEDPAGEYLLHYYPIEGFHFEPGYEYELIIREETVDNPPAGGSSLNWVLVEEVNKTPVESTPEEGAEEGSGRIVTAFIGPELVDCVGVAPMKCMQVKTNPDDDYGLFYDQIEGFNFEEGNEYELRVLVEPVENPPADASALTYTLVEEVSKTPVAVEQPETGEVPAAEGPVLEGPTWRLVNYVDLDGQASAVLPETRITITFEDAQASGSAGCNNYFGPYEINDNALTIGPLGSTMMACPDDIMLQETAYLASLGNVAYYEFVDGHLEMKDESFKTLMIFDVDEATALTGTIWNVTGYNNGKGGVTSVITGTEMNALFSDMGLVAGSAGCNDYRATYQVDGNNISVGPAAATRKLCAEPEGIMEQEAQYLAALGNAATYEIDGTRMDLYDEGGSRQATFEAAGTVEEALLGPADTPAEAEADAPVVEAEAIAPSELQLPGTSWQWVEMTTPLEQVTVDDPGQYLVNFMENGVIGIQADCNSGSGTYEANGGSLSIEITTTTLAMCAEDSLSDLFIRSLNAAAIYFEMDGNLMVDLFADAGTMMFAPN